MLHFKMLKFKFFIALEFVAVISCKSIIPEEFKNAKPISAHPRYQEHPLYNNLTDSIKLNSLIVGGQPADRGQFPHHALILIVVPTFEGNLFKNSSSAIPFLI